MVLKLPLNQKRMFWPFEKDIFQFFANCWVAKLKEFSGKVTQSIQNILNWNLVTGSFLENYLEAISSSKTNVLSVGKGLFSVFCKFLSDEVETISWESEPNRSKLFKSRFGQRNLLIKWFWRYLDLKNGLCEHFKRFFFQLFANFWVTKLEPFSGKVRQSV